MKKSKVILLAIFTCYMAMVVGVANATMILTLSDSSGATVSTSSNGGMVLYNGSVGNFIVNSTTGLDNPLLGNANNAMMDLLSVDVAGTAGGTLTITLTDNNFNLATLLPIVNNTIASLNIGGTQMFSSISYSAYLNDMLIGSLGTFTTSSFSGSLSNIMTIDSNPFTLTQVITITSNPGAVTSFDASVNVAPVPEPGTLLLLGGGLVGLVSFGRKRMKG